MDGDLKLAQKRLARARTERQRFEPLLNECFRLGLPGSRSFEQSTAGEDLAADVFDDTGAVALQEFASRIEAGVAPKDQRWLEFEATSEVSIDDREAVNRDLAEIQEFVFDELWQSNFAGELTPSMVNMGISTAGMLIEPGPRELFHHTSLAMTETYYGEDAWGNLTTCFRERECHAGDLAVLFPMGEFNETLENMMDGEADKPLTLIEYFRTDLNYDGSEESHKMTWVHGKHSEKAFEPSVIERKEDKGYGSSPFIGFRSGKAAGEVYGRGPFMTALPSVRTLNQVFELMLQSAALQLVPVFQVDDNDTINPDSVTIEPGAVIPTRPGSRGLEKVEMGAGDIRIHEIFQQIEGNKIKRAMFNDMLADPGKTPATAYEVAERSADLAFRLNSVLGRLHYEFMVPYGLRLLRIAEDEGKIELPVLNGKALRIRPVSPIAKALGQREVQQTMQYHQIVAAILGPDFATAQYDQTEALQFLRDRLGQHERKFLPIEEATQRANALTAARSAGIPAGGAQPAPLQQPS